MYSIVWLHRGGENGVSKCDISLVHRTFIDDTLCCLCRYLILSHLMARADNSSISHPPLIILLDSFDTYRCSAALNYETYFKNKRFNLRYGTCSGLSLAVTHSFTCCVKKGGKNK